MTGDGQVTDSWRQPKKRWDFTLTVSQGMDVFDTLLETNIDYQGLYNYMIDQMRVVGDNFLPAQCRTDLDLKAGEFSFHFSVVHNIPHK